MYGGTAVETQTCSKYPLLFDHPKQQHVETCTAGGASGAVFTCRVIRTKRTVALARSCRVRHDAGLPQQQHLDRTTSYCCCAQTQHDIPSDNNCLLHSALSFPFFYGCCEATCVRCTTRKHACLQPVLDTAHTNTPAEPIEKRTSAGAFRLSLST